MLVKYCFKIMIRSVDVYDIFNCKLHDGSIYKSQYKMRIFDAWYTFIVVWAKYIYSKGGKDDLTFFNQ